MKSVIYLDEKVPNQDRRFGSALEYYPVTVVVGKCTYKGLMTPSEVTKIIERGRVNPEDFPVRRSWWQRLIDWFQADG